MKMEPLKLIKNNVEQEEKEHHEHNDNNEEQQEETPSTDSTDDITQELSEEKKPKFYKLKQKGKIIKNVRSSLKERYRTFKKKQDEKKQFRSDMKSEGKKETMLRQTTDILPFVQIHDDHIVLKDGVMDIVQVETRNISSLNDADIEFLLMNQTQFLRSYFPSYKEVVLNFPTNVTEQRKYWMKKLNQATSENRIQYINQKLYEFDYLEKERYNREYFYFLYADDVENLNTNRDDCMQALQASFPLKTLSTEKKEHVLFLLNNQNTKL